MEERFLLAIFLFVTKTIVFWVIGSRIEFIVFNTDVGIHAEDLIVIE
jgi:hypothetical protein